MTDNLNKLLKWARECGAAVREGDICGEHVCVITFSPEYLQAFLSLAMKERDEQEEQSLIEIKNQAKDECRDILGMLAKEPTGPAAKYYNEALQDADKAIAEGKE